jgi:hypothetical protein
MKMELAQWEIVGLSPLLQDNPSSMGGGADEKQTATRKKIPSPAEEAAASAYRLAGGQLFHPSMAFRKALLDACAGKRIGKVGARTILSGAVFNVDDAMALVDPASGEPITTWAVDTRRAVVKSSGKSAGVHRSRARIEKWAGVLTLEVDRDFITDLELITDLLNEAGALKGVGNYRPEKGGPFGRFRATLIG